MFVDPNIAFSVDLAKGVKVQLADQGLEAIVAKVLGESFSFESFNVGSNDKSIPFLCPL